MLGFIRAAFVIATGWLLMKAVNRIVLTMQKQAEQIRNREAQNEHIRRSGNDEGRDMLDMKPCPHCGVYTSGACDNPLCTK